MKAVKILLGAIVALALVYGFGRFFAAQLGGGGRAEGPVGVVLAPPPGFAVEEAGELDRAAAAGRLAELLARRPAEARLGLHFTSSGFELYWLADRSDRAHPKLLERSAGPTGTRLETTWEGSLGARLSWGAEHGGFDPPGLSPGERKNLYH